MCVEEDDDGVWWCLMALRVFACVCWFIYIDRGFIRIDATSLVVK